MANDQWRWRWATADFMNIMNIDTINFRNELRKAIDC